MAGSGIGTVWRVTTWGESHGKAIGVVIDGCPSGLSITEEMIQTVLDRRRPGQSSFATKRNEEDQVEILSGVFKGKSTGTPISLLIKNKDQRSHDYGEIENTYRPSHADYTYDEKYGFRDYRGGGRASGRETAGRVAAGAVALEFLKQLNIEVCAYTTSIGMVHISKENLDYGEISKNPFYMPDRQAADQASDYVKQVMGEQDSVGGVIECVITNLPTGLGEPVFDKLDACLGKAMLSIGAVKGVEIGAGFESATLKGSENNDEFYLGNNDYIEKRENRGGGVLGGISDGSPLVLRVGIKPTPSIGKPQTSINKEKSEVTLQVKGRHDPVIVPRVVVVVEAMAALIIADFILMGMTSRMDRVVDFYNRKDKE